jgi:hypothetical protein
VQDLYTVCIFFRQDLVEELGTEVRRINMMQAVAGLSLGESVQGFQTLLSPRVVENHASSLLPVGSRPARVSSTSRTFRARKSAVKGF